MTPDKTPSDSDLQERCAEIVEWQRTGVLPGNALRNYAAKHWAGHTDALQMAERDTSALAMEQIAKWGSPVVAGEQTPCAECDGTGMVSGSQAHFLCPECTTPQPTQPPAGARVSAEQWEALLQQQARLITAANARANRAERLAQAGAVPLHHDDVRTYARNTLGDVAEESGFLAGVRWAEEQHGIKEGGQHGTE